MKRTVLLALMFACGAVQAAEWVPVVKSTDGKSEVFVDVSDIKVAGNIRRVWLKDVAAHHTEKGAGSDLGKWVTYSLSRYAFDCDDETAKFEALTVYYDDGTNWSALAGSLPALWSPVAPETMLHFEMDFTCSWKPK